MSGYRLLKHHQYESSARRLPAAIQHKAQWAQVLLAVRGRTPSVKGVTGYNARWRRTPVQGNHFYLWWIPRSESQRLANWPASPADASTILVHSIRHHDQTDEPIDLGRPEDYSETPIDLLDPRFEEQQEVSERVIRQQVALTTIKGLPGSGKTISLLYLVRDIVQCTDIRKALYVTYTPRLKRMAREFFDAQGETVAQKVSLRLLSEIENELTGLPIYHEPLSELNDFIRFLEQQNPAALGQWRRYPQTLYTELRSQVLGRTFPPTYHLAGDKFEMLLRRAPANDPLAYASERGLEPRLAELAVRLAERLQNSRFLQDQRAAYRALEIAAANRLPRWLNEIDALIVDEVQDLTLLQLALLGEIARTRLRKTGERPFIFTVAGDESQIVQPSGFEWGLSKDLLGEQIGIWPNEFEFLHQRRAPRNLARLIDNTWNFYLHLPKQLRPSARRQAFLFGDEADSTSESDLGRILLCPLPANKEIAQKWPPLLRELASKPGRALIDLSEQLRLRLPPTLTAATHEERLNEEILFLAREIKGLERSTVLIYGLEELYQRSLRLCEAGNTETLPYYEARRIFDEVRVALSRTTDKLVLLETADAAVLSELGIHDLPGVFTTRWDELLEMLQGEEMSEIEVIEGMLAEVDDLLEQARWEPAYQRNRRAFTLAQQAEDLALQREAQEQYIQCHLREAASWLSRHDGGRAHERNRLAGELANAFGDPLLIDEVQRQGEEIHRQLAEQAQQHLKRSYEFLQQASYRSAHHELITAHEIVQAFAPNYDYTQLSNGIDKQLAAVAMAWAQQIVEEAAAQQRNAVPEQVATLLTTASLARQRQADAAGAQASTVLAARYTQVPQRRELTPDQVRLLLDHARRYVTLIRPRQAEPSAYVFVNLWLDECFESLTNEPTLFADWTQSVLELANFSGYTKLDDRLWELEVRAKELFTTALKPDVVQALTRFRALASLHGGDPAEASRAWEAMGDLLQAAQQARHAGELERAYALLRQAKAAIPDELAVAVKALRLLQQLEQKHQALQPAERQALQEELARLYTIMESETN